MKPMNGRHFISADRPPMARGVELRLVVEGAAGQQAAAQPLTMVECGAHEIVQPFATIPLEAAQQLMDDLWRAGIRPAHNEHTAETVKALQDHTKDLRRVAFKLLKIEE